MKYQPYQPINPLIQKFKIMNTLDITKNRNYKQHVLLLLSGFKKIGLNIYQSPRMENMALMGNILSHSTGCKLLNYMLPNSLEELADCELISDYSIQVTYKALLNFNQFIKKQKISNSFCKHSFMSLFGKLEELEDNYNNYSHAYGDCEFQFINEEIEICDNTNKTINLFKLNDLDSIKLLKIAFSRDCKLNSV